MGNRAARYLLDHDLALYALLCAGALESALVVFLAVYGATVVAGWLRGVLA